MLTASRFQRIAPDLAAGAVVMLGALLLLPGGVFSAPASIAVSALVYAIMAVLIGHFWTARRLPFGWPNRVTLVRAALVAALAGTLVFPKAAGQHGAALAAVAIATLLLDGVDGWLARRTGSATAFGARFDMEVDALLILVLCLAVVLTGKAGPWVLAIGLMRYGFILAGYWWTALKAPLAPSRLRQGICVLQGLVLSLCLLPAVPPSWAAVMAALALGALAWSFVRDSLSLMRRHGPDRGFLCNE